VRHVQDARSRIAVPRHKFYRRHFMYRHKYRPQVITNLGRSRGYPVPT
jgi:hypothetical protein